VIKLDVDKMRVISVAIGVMISTIVAVLIPGSALVAELVASLLISIASGIKMQWKEPMGVPCHAVFV
jgi:hypothetical protein